MGQVVIQFEGVCVQLQTVCIPRLPAKHRIRIDQRRRRSEASGESTSPSIRPASPWATIRPGGGLHFPVLL